MCEYGVMTMAKTMKSGASISADFCCPSLVETPLDEAEAAELGRVLGACGVRAVPVP